MKKILLYDDIYREHIVINDKSIKKEYIIDLYCYLKYLKYKILRRYGLETCYSYDINIEELIILFKELGINKFSLIFSYYECDKTIPPNIINLIDKYNFDILEEQFILKLKPFPKDFLKDFDPLFIFTISSIENILNNINYYEEKFKNLDYRKIEDYFIQNIKCIKERDKRLCRLKYKLTEKCDDLFQTIFISRISKEDLEKDKSKTMNIIKDISITYNLYTNFYERYLIKRDK